MLGHTFPVWLKFKGGKGVSTAFGMLLAVVPASAMVGITTCVVVCGDFRVCISGEHLCGDQHRHYFIGYLRQCNTILYCLTDDRFCDL